MRIAVKLVMRIVFSPSPSLALCYNDGDSKIAYLFLVDRSEVGAVGGEECAQCVRSDKNTFCYAHEFWQYAHRF